MSRADDYRSEGNQETFEKLLHVAHVAARDGEIGAESAINEDEQRAIQHARYDAYSMEVQGKITHDQMEAIQGVLDHSKK